MIMISVIIPVYGCGKKIYACLDSLKKQTYKGFEVIIVNDCSPDDSKSIIEDYISRNPDLKVKLITHEVNKRCGGARNTGVKNSNGEYVFYLDQDDYLAPETLEKLLENNKNYDCISCDVKEANGGVYSRTSLMELPEISDINREKLILEHGYVFGMLIKRSLLIDKDVCFPENVMFEDVFYNTNLFLEINSFLHVCYCGVIRVGSPDSQTASLSLPKIKDRIKSVALGYESAKKRNNFDSVKNRALDKFFYYAYYSNVYFMLSKHWVPFSMKIIEVGKSEAAKVADSRYWINLIKNKTDMSAFTKFYLIKIYKNTFYSMLFFILCSVIYNVKVVFNGIVNFSYRCCRGVIKCMKRIIH